MIKNTHRNRKHGSNIILFFIFAVIVPYFLVTYLRTSDFLLYVRRKNIGQQVRKSCVKEASGWFDTDVSSASQGKLWKPTKLRTFETISSIYGTSSFQNSSTTLYSLVGFKCPRWAVVTTIFSPSHLIKQLASLDKWCLVVVGDKKSNDILWSSFVSKAHNSSVYLSESAQRKLPYSLVGHTPWNHFGRKNIGYLYAIHHGAEVIWDTDDDNQLNHPELLNVLENETTMSTTPIKTVGSHHHLWNPYPEFRLKSASSNQKDGRSWPRGFPLSYVKDDASNEVETFSTTVTSSIGVFQSLADNDPDVDAIYRLTQPLPLFFNRSTEPILVLPNGRVAPFNAQATFWKSNSFWALYLPTTVHGRVSDIWRSYFAQCLMHKFGLYVAFMNPLVTQFRNVHSYTADLQAEIPLYTKTEELTLWLKSWNSSLPNDISKNIEQLYKDLYEIGVIEIEDVLTIISWLTDLKSIGYRFS